ncbi:4773_t:CDS:2 [Gigaspora margarita]|uniref:4773_t:CDS:1 n=1 Tax=Gigaspora margarita TaxID=4874 RepID=A0ABN7UYD3_GIGMA|nr:4773_t:CDS:2 [Gigaspora margarita]
MNELNNVNPICNGLRPKFSEDIPLIYIDLANNCMKESACDRPSASDIQKVLDNWTKENYYVNVLEKADIKSDNFKTEHSTNSYENSIIKSSSINSESILFSLPYS